MQSSVTISGKRSQSREYIELLSPFVMRLLNLRTVFRLLFCLCYPILIITMEPIILASKSPQRQDILRSLNIPFIAIPADIDETLEYGLSPEENVERLAIKKTEAILRSPLKFKTSWIIGADTLIFIDGQPMGKPSDVEEARKMLMQYSNRSHQVITGLCCYDDNLLYISTRINTSVVTFKELLPQEIEWYLNLGEWQGAAGGYRIQGFASCFITRIEGSYSSIVGLPIYELYDILGEHGYDFK